MSKEYIERGALVEVLGRNSIIDKITYADGKTTREKIVDFPAADVVEVKHGRWKFDTNPNAERRWTERVRVNEWRATEMCELRSPPKDR